MQDKKTTILTKNKEKTMKSKIIMLLCLVCTAFVATSCLNDNNDNSSNYVPLTPEQKHTLCMLTSGSYQGYVYYAKEGDSSKADSVLVNYVVNDSTLTMNDYPVKSLAPYVNDASVKAILAEAPGAKVNFDFNGYEIISSSAAVAATYYSLWMVPQYKNYKYSTSFKSEKDGKTHTIDITFSTGLRFYNNIYYAMASYQGGNMQANIIVTDVAVDNNTYGVNNVFGMRGKKGGYNL